MKENAIKPKSPREIEIERLEHFPEIPASLRDERKLSGVLLGDQIEFLCGDEYRLLYPYARKNIKAASYELRVGHKYSTGGVKYDIQDGAELTIKKFEVAVVEILETVNMPSFLIGRWNIRTRWAYRGLIWVGGPQVDPGYRGRLMCPLWNLSNKDFVIKCGEHGEPIAVIDFVTTSHGTSQSAHFAYPWKERTRFVFEDYIYDDKGEVTLRSGLVEDAVQAIENLRKEADKAIASRDEVERAVHQNRDRIDNVTSVMFAALGVLIAAIAIFATKAPNDSAQHWWDPTVFFLCWSTTILALFAWVRSASEGKWWRVVRLAIGGVAILVILLQIRYQTRQLRDSQATIERVDKRLDSVEKSNAHLQELLGQK